MHVLQFWLYISIPYPRWANLTQGSVGCSPDVEIVDVVEKHFLEVVHPLSRPAVEHAMQLHGIVESMRQQMYEHSMSASPFRACRDRA